MGDRAKGVSALVVRIRIFGIQGFAGLQWQSASEVRKPCQ